MSPFLRSVIAEPDPAIVANLLAGAQDLLHDPRRCHCHDSPQPPLVGGQEQAGDGADQSAALGYDARGCVGIRRAAQISFSAATPAAGGGTGSPRPTGILSSPPPDPFRRCCADPFPQTGVAVSREAIPRAPIPPAPGSRRRVPQPDVRQLVARLAESAAILGASAWMSMRSSNGITQTGISKTLLVSLRS